MTRDEFWKIIDDAAAEGDASDTAEAVQETLKSLTLQDILAFDKHMDALMAESYTWSLWGAAYLINGGCSDDGFDYFRGWLIAQGRAVFEKAMANPDSLADYPGTEEEVECEEMLSVARSAYDSVTGEEMPGTVTALPDLGEGWDFDDDAEMKRRYPKLFDRFCSE